jgi:hypothetical protein
VLGEPERAVTDHHVRVPDPVAGEVRTCGVGEICEPLDTPHLMGEAREQSRLPAVARADLEHRLVNGESERVDHARDQRRLRGHLVVRDRQRHIDLCACRMLGGHEPRSGELGDRRQKALVAHTGLPGGGHQIGRSSSFHDGPSGQPLLGSAPRCPRRVATGRRRR